MPQAEVFSAKGEKVGEMGLSEAVFGQKPNVSLVRASVLSHLARKRQGTVGVKTRAQVRGGGRKPWRQKGLGRARAGTITSPIWRTGGVAFGPVMRDYGWSLPKKAKRLALLSALSARAQQGGITVLTEFKMDAPKTKTIHSFLKTVGAEKKALFVTMENEPNLVLSVRNIPGVRVVRAQDLSTYDTMEADRLFITQDAMKKLEEALS